MSNQRWGVNIIFNTHRHTTMRRANGLGAGWDRSVANATYQAVRQSEDLKSYIISHSEAKFTHGCCEACAKKLYPEIVVKMEIFLTSTQAHRRWQSVKWPLLYAISDLFSIGCLGPEFFAARGSITFSSGGYETGARAIRVGGQALIGD